MIARFLRHSAASYLGRYGNQVRREREREHIRATTRAMRVELKLPPAKALG